MCGRYSIFLIRYNIPRLRFYVVTRARDFRFKNNVAAELEPVGHVTRVLQQFGLCAVFFPPIPVLLKVFVE